MRIGASRTASAMAFMKKGIRVSRTPSASAIGFNRSRSASNSVTSISSPYWKWGMVLAASTMRLAITARTPRSGSTRGSPCAGGVAEAAVAFSPAALALPCSSSPFSSLPFSR